MSKKHEVKWVRFKEAIMIGNVPMYAVPKAQGRMKDLRIFLTALGVEVQHKRGVEHSPWGNVNQWREFDVEEPKKRGRPKKEEPGPEKIQVDD